jgi:hypothetical protein
MAQQVGLPRLSTITQVLAQPEIAFEATVKQAMGIDIPPGPQSVLLRLQRDFEAGRSPDIAGVARQFTPPRPEVLIQRLPRVPSISEIMPSIAETGVTETPATITTSTESEIMVVPGRGREVIEII